MWFKKCCQKYVFIVFIKRKMCLVMYISVLRYMKLCVFKKKKKKKMPPVLFWFYYTLEEDNKHNGATSHTTQILLDT